MALLDANREGCCDTDANKSAVIPVTHRLTQSAKVGLDSFLSQLSSKYPANQKSP